MISVQFLDNFLGLPVLSDVPPVWLHGTEELSLSEKSLVNKSVKETLFKSHIYY